jgi:hypothetical protein
MTYQKKGFLAEQEIIKYINETQKYDLMNNNIKSFLNDLFNFNLKEHTIYAKKFGENYKPDIAIHCNGITKYVSIKTGSSNSIHQEHLYSFINFLQTLGAPQEIILIIKEFQFNDKTTDGSGTMRKPALEYQIEHQEKIQKLNKFFNNEFIAPKMIERLLFSGEYFNIPNVDYIYHGNLENGHWACKNDILKYLLSKKIYSASPHVSKLYYQSLHRNLKHDIYFEFRRYYIQFKWHSIKEDIEFISKHKKRQ